MATITTSSPYFYADGVGGVTAVAGYETKYKRTRVVRYEFKTTSMGASSVSWQVGGLSLGGGAPSLNWYIGTSNTSHSNACSGNTINGQVSLSSNTSASGSANIVLQPNTTYYLWIFPASTTFGYLYWSSSAITIEVIGSSSSLSLSTTSVNIGEEITATITSSSSSFKHTVEFYIDSGSKYYQKYTNVGTSQTFEIPSSWYEYMKSSTSCTAYCRVTTYNGDTQIGSSVTKSFTVRIPGEIKPSLGNDNITLEISKFKTADNAERSILVKDKNTVTMSVSGCAAGEGSSIKNYKFEVLLGSNIIESKTTTGSSVKLGPFSVTGSLQFKATVTDNRGRSTSYISNTTYECYNYYSPSIIKFNAYRANSDGSVNANGEYLHCTYDTNYASVNGTNSIAVIAHYSDSVNAKTANCNNGTVNISLNGDKNSTYKVYLEITDNYGRSDMTDYITVFGATRILNIRKDGTGLAVGKIADNTSGNLFECAWPAEFYQGVECNNLTVNNKDIATLIQETIASSILNSVYPVGSIYMSVESTNPATLFGGTWAKLEDRFLIGKSSKYTSEGGNATVKLTQNQLPKIEGSIYAGSGSTGSSSGGYGAFRDASGVFSTRYAMQYGRPASTAQESWPSSGNAYSYVDMSVGNNEAHDNMPPYLPVYMWKRTA